MTATVFPLYKKTYTLPAYFAVVLLLSALCFGSLKDHLLFTHDDEIQQDYPRLNADPAFFFSPDKATVSGRPIDELVMWAAYAAWGDNPAFFHLLSVACHVLASLCLVLAYSRLGANRELSLFTGLLFLLNVTHIQAVQWISALEYPLAMLLIAATVYYYGAYASTRSTRHLVAFYALAAVSLLAHVATVMTWPFCLAWSLSQNRGWRRTLRELAPLFLLLLPMLYLVMQITPTRTSTWDAAGSYAPDQIWTILAGSGRTLVWFVGRLFSTAHWLSLAPSTKPSWEVALGIGALAGLGFLLWRRNATSAWAAWTLLFLVPFLVLPERMLRDMPVGPSRYLYIASAGSSFLLAWIVQQVGLRAAHRHKPSGRVLYASALIGLICISVLSIKKAEALSFYMSARHYLASGDNKTGVAQLEQAVALGPDIINLQDAYERMGLMYLLDPGRFTDFITPAVRQFPASIPLEVFNLVYISVNPETPRQREARDRLNAIGIHLEVAQWIGTAYNNLGIGLYDNGETTRAIAAYQHSLRFLPDRATTLKELAKALQKQGDQPAATAAMLRAAQIAPHDQSTLYNASLGLFIQGKTARAVEYCLAALELQPEPKLYSLLGTCYRQLGEQEQAIAAYRQSIVLAPKNFIAYSHLSNILERPQAIKTLEQALAAGIEHAELYKRLGRLYFEQGEAVRAAELHRRAIAIAPDDVQAHTNLGAILKTLGQWQEAHRAYEQAYTLEPHNPTHQLKMSELGHLIDEQSVSAVRNSIETH